jgi:sugar lactone lactonase YvrE
MNARTRLLALFLLGVLALTPAGCGTGTTPSKPVTPPAANVPTSTPDVISLPDGFAPEGITSAGNDIFVGSIPTGAIYRADITSGEGTIAVPARADHASLGMKIDDLQRLWVAGGPTGKAFVHDARSGAEIAAYTLSTDKQTFINDVVLTPGAAWFTDSKSDSVYRVAIPNSPIGGPEAVSALKLTGDYKSETGADAFNLNGIAWTGTDLIAVQSATGTLFKIDPKTGMATRIDLGGEKMEAGDGLLIEGQTLFVVQNRLNKIAVIDMANDFLTGKVSSGISSPDFDVPTTVTATGTSLYLPNARFGTSATATTTYTVVRVGKP